MSFKELRQNLGRLRFSLVVIVVIGLAAWLGYEISNARLGFLFEERERLTERMERLREQNEQLEYQVNILRVERDVDRVAITNLQRDLRDAHEKGAEIRRELAFFQSVMTAELDGDGVTIDSLVLWQADDDMYHVRLILLQLDRAEPDLTTGSYSITLHGHEDDAAVQYDVLELAGVEHANGQRPFTMNYFSRFDGTLVLPAGLVPEMIEVEVRVRGGNQTTQQFTWTELTESEEQPILPEDLVEPIDVGR